MIGSLSSHERPLGAVRCALLFALFVTACGKSPTPTESVGVAHVVSALVGDSRLDVGEQCDDGNTTSGDGCSSTGAIEAGYLCHVPGRACSLASLCGNLVDDPGEACDDGNTTANANGCAADCGLSLCGNGALNARQWPNFDQEICDDGNRVDGDGCSALCTVESGFGCSRTAPSRCTATGIRLFGTGVDDLGRRLEAGTDPHWRYEGSGAGAAFGTRDAPDWPLELPSARFMSAPLGPDVCVYQDFFIPSTKRLASFHVDLATFNDNSFSGASINGQSWTPVVISEPAGQPWQKNIVRRFASSAFRYGLNRIALCNENAESTPNAYRYLVADADDDRCGDGVVAARERCDDGNTANGDGCSSSCVVEATRVCFGQPSRCVATCGNGVLNAGEQCDDGDLASGDGCSDRCEVERGYGCPTVGASCVQTCGDGVVAPGEECDDHALVSGDGCSGACRVELGFACSGSPSVCTARCGNGGVDPGELCDDGNRRAADGCSNACTLEAGYVCPTAGQPCVATCGNGTVDAAEGCDDGNLVTGDGCTAECSVEVGYACSAPAAGPSVCASTCGNGSLDPNETCDDGNATAGDGCSVGCRVERGFGCSGAPSVCATICGDGVRAGAERCDDGGTSAGDGCSATCVAEAGWACLDVVCFQTCGNGLRNAGEECDDGNATAGDGCGSSCRREPGFLCTGSPDVCAPLCGDGMVTSAEACDDGNATAGDGCSPRCLREAGAACTSDAQCEGRCSPNTQTCTDDDVAPAAPSLTSPADASTLVARRPTIEGTAEPLSTVTILVDGTAVGTTQATAAGTFDFVPTADLALGERELGGFATDDAGNEGPSATAITVTIVECLGDEHCAPGTTTCDAASHACVPVVVVPMDAGVDTDAGVVENDGGAIDVDAGVHPRKKGGCSTSSAGAPSSGVGVLVAFAFLGASLRRRTIRRLRAA